jgi:RNA polymerase sigma-70 factor (ECF subfamily)
MVSRLRPGIISHLLRYEKDIETRNHLANTTFSKLWTEIDKYSSDKGNFSTWAYTIARNEALQHKRYTNRNFSYDEMFEAGSKVLINADNSASVDEAFNESPDIDVISILYDKVLACIYTLDEIKKSNAIYKEALIMKVIEKKKYSHIAQIIGVNENTIKSRIRNGKRIIGTMISKQNPELVDTYKKILV